MQGRLQALDREQPVPLLDRLGIHLGEVVIREHGEGLKPRDLYGSNVESLKGITRAGFTQTILGASSTSNTGTQLYMAPELVAGKPASIRSDIYSSLGSAVRAEHSGGGSPPLTRAS